MIDYGIFYEFVPLEDIDKPNPRVASLDEISLNKNYALAISTSAGLWRYLIGDTVKFTQKDPYKFIITGRTKHFINAFGEELMVVNADKGLAKPAPNRELDHRLLGVPCLWTSTPMPPQWSSNAKIPTTWTALPVSG
jgi:hypothetical protein